MATAKQIPAQYVSKKSKYGFNFAFYQERAKEAYTFAKELKAKKYADWSECLKCAWRKIRAEVSGYVKFVKKSTSGFLKEVKEEIREAYISTVEGVTPYKSMSKDHVGLYLMVDREKMTKGKTEKDCIITCYLSSIIS